MKANFLFILVFWVFGSKFTAQIPNYVPQNNLIGWWPFNGNANDESGNGNHGTVIGATLSSDRFGFANQAYGFSNSMITINNSFYNNGWSDYSISIWALTTDATVTSQNIYNTYPHDGEGFGFNHPNAPDKFSFWKNSNINVHAWNIFSANPWNYSTIQDNSWYHLVIVKSNLTYKFYVNGVLDKVSIANTSAQSQMCGISFGSIGGSEYFNGMLDDAGIWDRALSECEIADLYHSQQGFLNTSSVVNETALDAYTWPLNNQTYTQSGIYTTVIPNAAGCDSTITLNLTLNFTGLDELGTVAKKLVKITDLNGKIIPRRKNTLMLFIYEDGTVERVVEME
jgi:hypothetical protein